MGKGQVERGESGQRSADGVARTVGELVLLVEGVALHGDMVEHHAVEDNLRIVDAVGPDRSAEGGGAGDAPALDSDLALPSRLALRLAETKRR